MSALLLALLITYGPYQAKVLDVLDAGTLRVEVYVWPDVTRMVTVQIEGLNTPKPGSACESEKLIAKDALEFTRALAGQIVTISQLKKSGDATFFGQIKAQNTLDIKKSLISAGYGVEIRKGAPAHSWCS